MSIVGECNDFAATVDEALEVGLMQGRVSQSPQRIGIHGVQAAKPSWLIFQPTNTA